MGKLAFVFPGQGAQTVGMGQALAEAYPVAGAIFDRAGSALGTDMRSLCFEGPEEDLKKTENTQPAILTVSYAVLEILRQEGISPDMTAGLSLGEYTALVCAGVISFEDAVRTVRQRGRFMQEEVPQGIGAMAAIMGIEDSLVIEACAYGSQFGICEPANFNCPQQLVIAGEAAAVEKGVEKAKELGAKKAVMLPVSAPFHTSMLRGAGEKLESVLAAVPLKAFEIPVISNVHGQAYAGPESVQELLVKQVSNPVRWGACVQQMIDDGVDCFVEVGPGNALSKFIKRVSKDVMILNVEDPESLEKTLEALKKRRDGQ